MITTVLKTDIGLLRSENQDACGETDLQLGKLVVVCDGVGGYLGGAKAAQLAVKAVLKYFSNCTKNQLTSTPPTELFRQAFNAAQKDLYRFAKEEPKFRQMSTTIVAAWVYQNTLIHTHIGDSRLYLQRDKKLHRLTKDHSPVQEMVDLGLITEDEMDTHPKSNLISEYIGVYNGLIEEIPVAVQQIAADDLFLLCTDGLNGMVQKTEIETILNSGYTLQKTAEQLIEKANKEGGKDNITVVLVQV